MRARSAQPLALRTRIQGFPHLRHTPTPWQPAMQRAILLLSRAKPLLSHRRQRFPMGRRLLMAKGDLVSLTQFSEGRWVRRFIVNSLKKRGKKPERRIKPLFSQDERQAMADKVGEKLKEIGDGHPGAAGEFVKDRWQRFQYNESPGMNHSEILRMLTLSLIKALRQGQPHISYFCVLCCLERFAFFFFACNAQKQGRPHHPPKRFRIVSVSCQSAGCRPIRTLCPQ